MSAAPAVKHNAAENQFESLTAHGVARLRYVRRGDVLDLTHTSVPQDAEGQGIGSQLARAAFEIERWCMRATRVPPGHARRAED